MQKSTIEERKWHKNYTRLMPYYYTNHKAKLVYHNNPALERQVKVRKIIKSVDNLVLEVVEKIDPTTGEKKSRKRLKEETLKISWDELEEISFQVLKSSKWSLNFLR